MENEGEKEEIVFLGYILLLLIYFSVLISYSSRSCFFWILFFSRSIEKCRESVAK